MANSDFNDDTAGTKGRAISPPPVGVKGPSASINEKTAAWGALPGKTGPNRSAGVPKLKTFPKSEGI